MAERIFRWLLKICLFGRPHCCSGEMIELRMGFSLEAIIVERILKSAFDREMGGQSLTDLRLGVLGINLIRARD